MLSVLFNSEKHNQLFHHYDSESIYVLFQVMYEVYIEKNHDRDSVWIFDLI